MTCYVLFVRHLRVFVLGSEIFGPNFKHRPLLGNKIMQAWAKQGFIHYSLPKNPVVFLVLPNHCYYCTCEATHTEEGRKWIWGHTGNQKQKSSLWLAQCETDSFFSAYLMSAAQRQDHYNRFRHLHRIKPKQWKQNEFLNQCPRVTLWQAGQELSDSLLIAAVKQQHRAPHKHTSPGHTVWTQCAGMFSTPSSLPMCNLHYMIITFTRPTMCVMTFTCAQNKQHTYLLGAGHFFPRTWSEKAQSL